MICPGSLGMTVSVLVLLVAMAFCVWSAMVVNDLTFQEVFFPKVWRPLQGTTNHCWSCHHEAPMGISLDDSDEIHVCDSCWAKIPIAWRLLVTRYFREDKPNLLASLFEGRN